MSPCELMHWTTCPRRIFSIQWHDVVRNNSWPNVRRITKQPPRFLLYQVTTSLSFCVRVSYGWGGRCEPSTLWAHQSSGKDTPSTAFHLAQRCHYWPDLLPFDMGLSETRNAAKIYQSEGCWHFYIDACWYWICLEGPQKNPISRVFVFWRSSNHLLQMICQNVMHALSRGPDLESSFVDKCVHFAFASIADNNKTITHTSELLRTDWGVMLHYYISPNVAIAVRIYSTLQMNNCRDERSFTTNTCELNHLRSIMFRGPHRLAELNFLCIESDALTELDCIELIDDFAQFNCRSVEDWLTGDLYWNFV